MSSNKFNNDGSFLEQFKKLSQKKTDAVLPKKHEAFTGNDTEEKNSDISKESSEKHPDWFQEALKRAREKAQELKSVSHAVPSHPDDDPPSKKSRWSTTGEQSAILPPAVVVPQQANVTLPGASGISVPTGILGMIEQGQHMEAIRGVMITRLSRDNPVIVNYARQVFGSLDLSDAQWKQCEEQMKMNVVFQLLEEKRKEMERLEQQGKVKYEYDSDEEVDGGTWEHKRRKKEMEDTANWADNLTQESEGKHHIGDFLPPQELARFMERYRAIKEGRDPDLSDYKDHKITEDNVGYRMLKSMGWTEGTGLGAERSGITQPVNQNARTENSAIGVERPDALNEDDDEYDAYRKRMMLAYRYRPNPLNNPRRSYY